MSFGIGNYISDCQSALFAGLDVDLIIRIIYISQCTHFKLMIDFRLECFQAGGGGGGRVSEKRAANKWLL